MPRSLSFLTSRWAVTNVVARRDALRVALIAALHVTALYIMATTEYALEQKAAFVLTWGVLNFFWLALLRRPGVSAAISLTMIVLLIELSQLKWKVLWMTVNFVDLMIIDPDTISFLFTIFPGLTAIVLAAAAAAIPILVLLWRLDPFRVRRLSATAGMAGCLTALVGISQAVPLGEYEGFYGHNYVSHFARSGVEAVSALMSQGFMESDAVVSDRLKAADQTCQPAHKLPHIIMVHDESAFDMRRAPGIRVPPGYGDHFRSFDGKRRRFVVEGAGGPSWYTEYNVLAGLSARSFGRFSYFVTRIAVGRVERGLPHALRRCGYQTFSLYPSLGAFMSAGSFQKTTGIQNFYDARAMGSTSLEPDRFYYDAAAKIFERERGNGPTFVFVYLAANHFPWDYRWRPDLFAAVEGPRQSARRRRVSAASDHGHAGLRRLRRPPQARLPDRVVPDRALRRPPARFRVADARAGDRRRRPSPSGSRPTIRATSRPTTRSTRSTSNRSTPRPRSRPSRARIFR